MTWRPIETAPKDGSGILLYHEPTGMVMSANWSNRLRGWEACFAYRGEQWSHWMPLPEPPK